MYIYRTTSEGDTMITLEGMHCNVHRVDPEVPLRVRRYVPPKRRSFTELYGVIRQKRVLFIVMAARAPNPLYV